jgi:hypothetical protein
MAQPSITYYHIRCQIAAWTDHTLVEIQTDWHQVYHNFGLSPPLPGISYRVIENVLATKVSLVTALNMLDYSILYTGQFVTSELSY